MMRRNLAEANRLTFKAPCLTLALLFRYASSLYFMKRSQFLRAAPFLAMGSLLLVPTAGEAKKRKKKKKGNKKKKRTPIRLKKPGEPSSIKTSKADQEKENSDPFDILRHRRLEPGDR